MNDNKFTEQELDVCRNTDMDHYPKDSLYMLMTTKPSEVEVWA